MCATRAQGKEKAEGARRWRRAHGTTRRVVAVALRAAVLGVRAGRRRRVARSRNIEEEPRVRGGGFGRGARRVAGGERRLHGVTVKTEREEREME